MHGWIPECGRKVRPVPQFLRPVKAEVLVHLFRRLRAWMALFRPNVVELVRPHLHQHGVKSDHQTALELLCRLRPNVLGPVRLHLHQQGFQSDHQIAVKQTFP